MRFRSNMTLHSNILIYLLFSGNIEENEYIFAGDIFTMKNELLILKKTLVAIGFNREADLIQKIAVPLMDAEPLYRNNQENISEKQLTIGDSPRKEWFDSIKLLRDNVVLFHFNESATEDSGFVNKLSQLFFGLDNPRLSPEDTKKQYNQIKYKNSVLGGENPTGGVGFNSFKKVFPEIKLSNGINPDETVFFIFNEQVDPKASTKTAPYFAHDLGHVAWDVYKTKYRKQINDIFSNIFALYENKDGKSCKEIFDNLDESLSGRLIGELVSGFVKQTFSISQDSLADLVALYANPEAEKEILISAPEEFLLPYYANINNQDQELFIYKLKDRFRAETIFTQFTESLEEHLSEEGLLPDEMKGKVFFWDFS